MAFQEMPPWENESEKKAKARVFNHLSFFIVVLIALFSPRRASLGPRAPLWVPHVGHAGPSGQGPNPTIPLLSSCPHDNAPPVSRSETQQPAQNPLNE